jgi:hypothetical protein
MLAFVTSLRHPDNSASYPRVEALLERTLRSIDSQTDGDYVVIVVCNQAPTFRVSDKVHIVTVDFPAPAPPAGPRTDRAPFVWDKGTKIGLGLIAARRWSPDYVMIFDADDFVSRRLVAHSKKHAGSDGWVITDGWTYSSARGVFKSTRRFNRTCGTSFVVSYDAYGVGASLDESATQREIAETFGERLNRILGAHRDALEWFTAAGFAITPLPFRGAVYHVDTGENHSGKSLVGLARPATTSLLEEFGIDPDVSALRSAVNGLGPIALAETAARAARRVLTTRARSRSTKA